MEQTQVQTQRKKLGQMLLERSFIDAAMLEQALTRQKERGGRLGEILLDMGRIKPRHLIETLAAQAGIERVNLDKLHITPDVLTLVPAELASKYNIPVSYTHLTLPTNREV